MSKVDSRSLDEFCQQLTSDSKPKPIPKMTEAIMQHAIYIHHGKPIFPNIHMGCNEWDAIHVSTADYLTCYEIKLSKSDFRADFKKTRHELLLNRWKTHPDHSQLRLGLLPKYVYYVCYGFSIDAEDVPEYAGLMIVNKLGRIVIVKQAPVLWKEKITALQYKELMRVMANRYIWGKVDIGVDLWNNWRKGNK